MKKQAIEKVLVLGAGKVGSTVADMMAEYHRLPVTLADVKPGRGDERRRAGAQRIALDVERRRRPGRGAGRPLGRDQLPALLPRPARGDRGARAAACTTST